MSGKKRKRLIFNPSGCLTPEAMLDYRGMRLDVTERNAVEAHLESCLFCSEALDGMNLVSGDDALRNAFRRIESRISEKAGLQVKERMKLKIPVPISIRTMGLAAAAAFAMLAVFYFTLRHESDSFFKSLQAGAIPVHADEVPSVPAPNANPDITALPDAGMAAVAPEIVPAESGQSGSDDSMALAESETESSKAPSVPVDAGMAGNTVSDDESRMHTAEEPGKVETYTQEGAARVSEVVGIVTTKEKRISRTAQKDKAEAEPFTVAEQMPAFPGGNDSLNVWFRRNLRYPSSAREAGITGRVYVGFVVSETGKVKDARIERSLQRDCDREALRLVRIMPSWIPGKQGGKAVAVRYVVPVDFSLP